jgi:hypothetical protein
MKDVKEFIEKIVEIEWIEQSRCFGHYPFQVFAEKQDGRIDLSVLDFGGSVGRCYEIAKQYVNIRAKRMFMSLDFPQGGDIVSDFVAVFSVIDGKSSILAIPYDRNGERSDIITESDYLDKILIEFNNSVFIKVEL